MSPTIYINLLELFILLKKFLRYVLYCLKSPTDSRSFIKRQASGRSSDNKWQRMTTSDFEDQQVVQRMTKSQHKWERVTTISNEWQQMRAVVQRMETAQYNSKNGWLPSFVWQKEIRYYFKGWMAAIRVVK